MRVAFVSHTYVEPANRGKIRELVKLGVDVTLFVPNEWNEPALKRKWTGDSGQETFPVEAVSVRRYATSPAAASWDLRVLRTMVNENKFDLIHMEEEPWSLVCGTLLNIAKGKVPTTLFTWQNLPDHPSLLLRVLARRRLRRIDGWVAGNSTAGELLRRTNAETPLTILPQIGIPEIKPSPREKDGIQRLAFVGRLVRDKGVFDLIEAIAIADSEPVLEFVGDGPEREELEAFVREKNLVNRVTFSGALPHAEVQNVWPRIDTLVLPSRTTATWAEQFGHVLIEAMAAGKAIIGSDSGAIPDVIGPGGKTFHEGDSRQLAKLIDELAVESEMVKFSERALARVEEFTDSRIAKDLSRFWEEEVLHISPARQPG